MLATHESVKRLRRILLSGRVVNVTAHRMNGATFIKTYTILGQQLSVLGVPGLGLVRTVLSLNTFAGYAQIAIKSGGMSSPSPEFGIIVIVVAGLGMEQKGSSS